MPRTQEVIAKNSTITGVGSGKGFSTSLVEGMSSGSLKTVKLSYLPVLGSVLTIMCNSIRIRSYDLHQFIQ